MQIAMIGSVNLKLTAQLKWLGKNRIWQCKQWHKQASGQTTSGKHADTLNFELKFAAHLTTRRGHLPHFELPFAAGNTAAEQWPAKQFLHKIAT